jgi:diacylglycerol kinase
MVDPTKSDEHEESNARADAIAVTAVLIIVITAVVYWLSRF